MMNPAMLLQFKKKWEEFAQRHPRFVQFANALASADVGEGSVIDVTVTLPDGRQMASNLRLTAEDIEMIRSFGK
ncbi:MAG: hypothetical protein K5659_04910 [Lachnospiraceae bacterium]|jgi:hypothetical protein|nr:hypothetical protein [Lachnospiraceae bacterium]